MRSKPQQPLCHSVSCGCVLIGSVPYPYWGFLFACSISALGVWVSHSCIPFSVIYFLLANAHNNFLLQLIILFNKPSLLKLQYFPGAMSTSSIQILVSKYNCLMAHSRTKVGKTQSETEESYSSRN